MKKSVLPGGFTFALLLFPLLSFSGCYSTVEVSDGSAEKAIAIDWVEPPCAEPGSAAGYIKGNGFGAKNVTITVGGIEAEVLTATGKDASFVVPEELTPGPIEVVVTNPGGRIATINWVVCGPGPDVDPPELVDFDFNPKSVDVSTQSQEVTCSMTLTDSPAGVASAVCVFASPSALQRQPCSTLTPVAGDRFNGLYECTATIPQNAEPGTWNVVEVVAADEVGNVLKYGTADLESLGFPTQLEVISTGGDTDPPELVDFDFNPKSVDVSTQSQEVTCSMTLTDSPAGVASAVCVFASPSALQRQPCSTLTPVAGDRFNGLYECTATIPQNAEPGTWNVVEVVAADEVGNVLKYGTADLESLGFPTQLDVTSTGGGDTEPPVLIDVDFTPKSVDVTAAPADVTCNVTVTDSPAGVDDVICWFYAPTTTQFESCSADSPTSGDVFNGVWSCTVTIPQGAEEGTWVLDELLAFDAAGNRRIPSYSGAELQSKGFPIELDVTSTGGGDTEPPVLIDVDFTPKSVDVTAAPADVTCNVTVTDSPAGVDDVICWFYAPTTTQFESCSADSPSSGDVFNGVWSCTVIIPQGAEEGTWVLDELLAFDAAGNRRIPSYSGAELQSMGFPIELDVTSTGGGDTEPPVLIDVDFTPKSVDVTAAPADVTCNVTVTDSPAGVDDVICWFYAPTTTQFESCSADSPTSGDVFNGVWSCTVTIPQGAEEGTWVLDELLAFDAAGNRRIPSYSGAELQSMGFPIELDVTSTGGAGSPP